ncbi:MAG TPA: VOC family protein [Thermoanaerobaculia bacterium]|nr:VOC family protein [Thermoanaerobaculia bacterium]
MTMKFAHTNLIARDWRALARFYEQVFGCTPVPPERDFRGADLDRGTGLHHAHLTGSHLRLPGYGDDGPTLEIFHYDELADRPSTAVNRPGFAHIAFAVDDVAAARELVLRHGGRSIGEIVTLSVATGAKVTWCYVADPEDNIVELQSWSR